MLWVSVSLKCLLLLKCPGVRSAGSKGHRWLIKEAWQGKGWIWRLALVPEFGLAGEWMHLVMTYLRWSKHHVDGTGHDFCLCPYWMPFCHWRVIPENLRFTSMAQYKLDQGGGRLLFFLRCGRKSFSQQQREWPIQVLDLTYKMLGSFIKGRRTRHCKYKLIWS